MHPPESARTAKTVITEVATRLHPRVGEMSEILLERLSSGIVELDGDAQITDLLYASIEGNVDNIVYLLRHTIGVENIEPPSAAYEYARRLAQRGVPVSSLVRAYRLGQQYLLEMIFAECERVEQDQTLRGDTYRQLVSVTFDYFDWISQGVVNVYESERERWLTERSSARAGRVEDLIAGTVGDIDAAESIIGYRLRVHHLATVMWVHETGTQLDQVSRFTKVATVLAELLGSTRAPLVIPRDRANAWAWFEVPEEVEIDLERIRTMLATVSGPPVPMVALGRPRPGIDGFRTSHLDAQQAREVALVRDDPGHPVTSFSEPALNVAALLAHDVDTTRPWVQETLGDLALDDEQHARLRHTLQLYFENDSSYTATADAMLMHKNSVKYRLASAEKALGRPISADRLGIELALTACHWLGRSVLIAAD